MTPLGIQIMIAHHCSSEPEQFFTRAQWESPATADFVGEMIRIGMLELDRIGKAQITDKGRAYVEHLCRVSVPEVSYSCRFEPPMSDMKAKSTGIAEGL